MARKRNNFRSSIAFENLEDRRLMAGDINFNSSTKTLTITGDQYGDRAEVRFEGSKVKVDLYAGRSNGSVDHHDQTRSIDGVQFIVFNGLGGDDALKISQGALNSNVTLNNLNVQYYGGDGNDQSESQSSVSFYAHGGNGNDTLNGGLGYDALSGDAGNDTLRGGQGSDNLDGGSGVDALYGDAGMDVLFGGTNGDYLFGGQDNDTFDGGEGNDVIRGEDGNDFVVGGVGNDIIYGGLGNDTISAGADNDWISGDDGNDTLYGGTGNDLIVGGNGNDKLYGDQGEDMLYGNDGNDSLDGGYDHNLDYLNGGAGADTFYSVRQRKLGFITITYETDTVADKTSIDTVVRVQV